MRLIFLFLIALLSVAGARERPKNHFVSVPSNFRLIGCYLFNEDDPERLILNHTEVSEPCMTQSYCHSRCLAKSYKYFGVRGEVCHCGNELSSVLQYRWKDAACNNYTMYRCGDGTLLCGTYTTIIVFATNASLLHANQEVSVPRGELIGCYRSAGVERSYEQLDFIKGRYQCMSHDFCRHSCQLRDFKYFGLTQGNRCFCWNRLVCEKLDAEKFSDFMCSTKCNGNSVEICGGSEAFLLFKVSANVGENCTKKSQLPRNPYRLLKLTNCSQSSGCENCEWSIDGLKDMFGNGFLPYSEISSYKAFPSWWSARLIQSARISHVVMYQWRHLTTSPENHLVISVDFYHCATLIGYDPFIVKSIPCDARGQTIRIQNNVMRYYSILEVQVFGEYLFETVPTATHIGCFTEDAVQCNECEGVKFEKIENITLDKCRNLCINNGTKFAYFAASARDLNCICGDYFLPKLVVMQGNCSTPCLGNPAELCGSTSSVSLYAGVPKSWKMPLPGVQISYMGCYKSTPGERCDRMHPAIVMPYMTISQCYEHCLERQIYVFGVTEGKKCVGFERFSSCYPTPLNDTACFPGYPCARDTSNSCGSGNGVLALYRILVQPPVPTVEEN